MAYKTLAMKMTLPEKLDSASGTLPVDGSEVRERRAVGRSIAQGIETLPRKAIATALMLSLSYPVIRNLIPVIEAKIPCLPE